MRLERSRVRGKERERNEGLASSRIPGYSRAWKTMPPSRQCALHSAPMNFHENYVRIFIPFLLLVLPPASPPRVAFVWLRFLVPMAPRIGKLPDHPFRPSFPICLTPSSSRTISSSETRRIPSKFYLLRADFSFKPRHYSGISSFPGVRSVAAKENKKIKR